MRIGLLLGTFDPPHIGHLYLAIKALDSEEVDQIWITPAWNSPWKPNATDFETRLKLCTALVRDCPNILACAMDRVAKSKYTHEFLKYLLETKPEHEFTIIAGSDIEFHKWKEGEWISNNFKKFIVSRYNFECSSTLIRSMVRDKINPIPYVPPIVYKLITEYKLYDS